MAQTSSRPNILFIMADQHRSDYTGMAGADFIRTPNLNRLAERGVRFDNCFTNSAVCAPARIGLASGLQPSCLGSLDNRSYLPASTTTLYKRFRDHGYRVGCVGKLDLAKPDSYNGRYGDRPCVYGWGFTHPEECEGKMHAGSSPTPVGPYTFYLQEKGFLEKFHQDYQERASIGWIKNASHDSVLPTEDFEDCYIGRRATEWLRKVPEDFPWHYFVSFVGPHDPFDPPAEFAERYRGAPMPEAIKDSMEGKPEWVRSKMLDMDDEEVTVTRRQYCAAIEAIDDGIGGILDVLETRGVLDNTIIVYTSDHGEMLGDHGLYKKSVAYEPALHVPLIVCGPGIEGGRSSDAIVELLDLNPTLCELAGLPQQENIDALSFAPVLRGRTVSHRPDAVSALRHLRCIRTERYKFIENYNVQDELYDMQEDPCELNNIAQGNTALVREMRERLRGRFTEGKWRR